MMKRARLIFAQVDHVSGEIIGFALEKIMELGANNVQLIPTVTKKNRPGNVLIIDTDVENEREIVKFLARELKVSGYHRIETSHIFQKVSFIKKKLTIQINGKTTSIPLEVKLIGDPLEPVSIDVEHDSLIRIQEIIHENLNSFISLNELRATIESQLKEAGDEIIID